MSRFSIGAGLLCVLSFAVGCGSEADTKPAPKLDAPTAATPKDDHGHGHSHGGHGAGPHDGTLADWGGGKFHVEFTVDHDKQEATVFVLGGDEKTATPIKASSILLSINDPKFQVELAHCRLQGNQSRQMLQKRIHRRHLIEPFEF